MSNIVVKNGIKLHTFDSYLLYEVYTQDANKYYMCLPINNSREYQMVIDFPEEYYKSLMDDDIIKEINNVCSTLYGNNQNYIYLLPNITTYDLSLATEENDNHAYRNLLRRLQKYTYSAYNTLRQNEDIKISDTICVVTQTVEDKKFIDWLDTEMPSYFKSINLNKLNTDKISTGDDSGFSTLSGPTEGVSNTKSNHKVKVLVPNKHGFLNITFTIVVMLLAMIIGIAFAFMMIR